MKKTNITSCALLVEMVVFLFVPLLSVPKLWGQKPSKETGVYKFLKGEDFDGSTGTEREGFGPTFDLSRTVVNDSSSKWPEKLYLNTWYSCGLMGTLTIPVLFNHVEIESESIKMGPAIDLGLGYTFIFGDFMFNPDGSMKIKPYFFFGLALTGGITSISKEDNSILDSDNIKSSFTVGGFIGFQHWSIFGGYDIPSGNPILGFSTQINLQSIVSDKLDLFGSQVRPVFKVRANADELPAEWYPR